MKDGIIYTKSGLIIATGYIRIVHGGRGDYVEIAPDQIVTTSIVMPKTEEWRMKYDSAYYLEYRSIDGTYTMVYRQKRLVSYADYKIGMFYVSINDIKSNSFGLGKFL